MKKVNSSRKFSKMSTVLQASLQRTQEDISYEVLQLIFGKLPECNSTEELVYFLTGDQKSYEFFKDPSANRQIKERILVSLQIKIRERLSDQSLKSLHDILWT